MNEATDIEYKFNSETYILGALMVWGEGRIACEPLSTVDFADARHQWLWALITELDDAGKGYTLDVVMATLQERGEFDRVGGGLYVIELQMDGASPATLPTHAGILRRASLLRAVREHAKRLEKDSRYDHADPDEILAEAEADLMQLQRQRETRAEISAGDIAKHAMAMFKERYDSKGELRGVPSGLSQLDKYTRGLQPTDLVILAARPSMGKTALALSLIEYAAVVKKIPTVFFSVEMGRASITDRLYSMVGRIEGSRVQSGAFKDTEWGRLFDATEAIRTAPLTMFDVPTLSVDEFRGMARKAHAQGKCKLIVVDYLQKMRATGEEHREREIAEISGGLKAIAKELNVPVLALAQLNRDVEKRSNKRPTMADLRESGSIEQDADLIMFLYRDEVYDPESNDKNVAEIIIGKHRNGELGTARVAWRPQYTRFENLSGDEE